MNEGLIAVDEPMTAAQDITFKPAFDGVLAQHLHDSTVRREIAAVGIFRKVLAEPRFLADLINCLEHIGLGFVRSKHAEVLHVAPHHFPQIISESRYIARDGRPRFLYIDGEVAKIRQVQWLT